MVVIAIVRFVRPWKPRSKTITARRPVNARATFTAFSTASAPAFTSSDFCSSPRQGDSSASCRQTSTYGSYIATMKHWCR